MTVAVSLDISVFVGAYQNIMINMCFRTLQFSYLDKFLSLSLFLPLSLDTLNSFKCISCFHSRSICRLPDLLLFFSKYLYYKCMINGTIVFFCLLIFGWFSFSSSLNCYPLLFTHRFSPHISIIITINS